MTHKELKAYYPSVAGEENAISAWPRRNPNGLDDEDCSGCSEANIAFIINFFYTRLHLVGGLSAIWELVMSCGPKLGFDGLVYRHVAAAGAPNPDDCEHILCGRACDELGVLLKSSHNAACEAGISNLAGLNSPQTLMSWLDGLTSEGLNVSLLNAYVKRNFDYGYIFPVFANHGRNSFIILNLQADLSTPQKYILMALLQAGHHKYCNNIDARLQPGAQLSKRERQVIYWVARGKSNSVIASIIGISPHTVNGYLRKIYLKTNTSDRTAAAIYAMRVGLII